MGPFGGDRREERAAPSRWAGGESDLRGLHTSVGAALLAIAGGFLAPGSLASGLARPRPAQTPPLRTLPRRRAVPAAPTRVAIGSAQRTFVSAGSGNDVNPCTRTAPCRNFQAA